MNRHLKKRIETAGRRAEDCLSKEDFDFRCYKSRVNNARKLLTNLTPELLSDLTAEELCKSAIHHIDEVDPNLKAPDLGRQLRNKIIGAATSAIPATKIELSSSDILELRTLVQDHQMAIARLSSSANDSFTAQRLISSKLGL